MMEIEAKIPVSSHKTILKNLAEYGIKDYSELIQQDVYYNGIDRDFSQTDEALRVRYDQNGAEITYKGPKEKNSEAKARKEINLMVNDGKRAEELITALGFLKTTTVVKERKECQYGGATVTLDTVQDLGTFVEIEVLTENSMDEALATIATVKKDLCIEGDHIEESYLELLLARCMS